MSGHRKDTLWFNSALDRVRFTKCKQVYLRLSILTPLEARYWWILNMRLSEWPDFLWFTLTMMLPPVMIASLASLSTWPAVSMAKLPRLVSLKAKHCSKLDTTWKQSMAFLRSTSVTPLRVRGLEVVKALAILPCTAWSSLALCMTSMPLKPSVLLNTGLQMAVSLQQSFNLGS